MSARNDTHVHFMMVCETTSSALNEKSALFSGE